MLREFLRHLSLELYRSPETVEAYSTDLHGFNDYLRHSGVDTDDAGFFIPSCVTSADIREWMSFLSEKGIKPVTLRRKLQSLRAFYKFLVKKGMMAENPALSIPLPKKNKKLPEITSVKEVCDVISQSEKKRDTLIIEMLFGFGLRRSELLSVTDADFNSFMTELRILGKGAKVRIMPVPPVMRNKIMEWQEERDNLFPDLPNPRPLIATRNGSMSKSCLYKIVNKALSNTSASQKSPHTLRHTFATAMMNSGAEINDVKELLGHSSLAATQVYTHLAFADLKQNWQRAHPRSKKIPKKD